MEERSKTLDRVRCREIGRTCACFNLRRAARAVTRLYEEYLKPTGLKATQYSVLMATHVKGPVTLTKLAEITVTERTTLTRNLDVLEKKGYLRIESGMDRRERQVSITDEGRKLLLEALPLWEKAQAHIEGGLGKDRLEVLLTGLSEVTRQVIR
jgi:DNA-binding MarR family transcriptional regulator